MMPDPHSARNDKSELELDELVGLVGNAYTRAGLSPPSPLHRRAVEYWLCLSRREFLDVLDKHFDEHRRCYLSGSGDGLFHLVEAETRKAIEAKPSPGSRARAGATASPPGRQVAQSQWLCRRRHVEGAAASLVRDRASNVEGPSGMAGYEAGGEPIGNEDD